MLGNMRLIIGVMIALGMLIVSISAIRGAAESTPVNSPQPLVNRETSTLSETVGDREQLRRHFIQDWRDRVRR